MMDLEKEFKENWHKVHTKTDGKKILLAVSGGVDSMVMARLFLVSGIPFAIAHCNFQLRGEDSMGDEALVKDFAEKNGLDFHSIRFDTKQKMQEWKKAVQETARDLRYEWLEGIRRDSDYSMIATAHHANDNVETLLMNLFKGTGMAGLHGIPSKNNTIIRPLLFAQKTNLSKYAETQNISFREDASNKTDAYKRNAIRNQVIPAIEQHFPGAVQQMNESITRFAQAEILYQDAINEELKKLVEKRGHDLYIPVLKLNKSKALEAICFELFAPYNFTPLQTHQVIQLLRSESGHFVASTTHRVIRHRDFLVITTLQEDETDIHVVDNSTESVNTKDASFYFTQSGDKSITSDPNIASLDLSKISFPLILRRWKIGDYFYPIGMGMKKKKLSRYLIDQKVPIHEKEKIWVLESDKRIVWVAGMRIDERFKIKPSTEKVLVVRTEKIKNAD